MPRAKTTKLATKPAGKKAPRTAGKMDVPKEERNTMILQVDEATRGLMQEIKNGITDGLNGSSNNTVDFSELRKLLTIIDSKIEDNITEVTDAKNSADRAADNADTSNIRLIKIENEFKKLADDQELIKDKLDEILQLLNK